LERDVVAKKRPGEFELIDRYFRQLASEPGAFGLADDAALYRQRPGDDLVITTDMVVSGVHFFEGDPPDSIAQKAVRVNLSDLAGKGAEPFGYLLSLALPAKWTEAWVKSFAKGLAADQKRYGISLLGGDTSRASGGLTIAITALGRVEKGRMVLRSGAKVGHAIFVSGTIGDSALGLRIRRGEIEKRKGAKHLLDRYLHPQPRTALAPLLARHASSAMDISDGLVGDLAHICTASEVGAEIGAYRVPLSKPARTILDRKPGVLAAILNGGEDYEILATVPTSSMVEFAAEATQSGVPVTRIGTILRREGPPIVRDETGKVIKLAANSYTHF
jgi:thiamine-monophosphate kinase